MRLTRATTTTTLTTLATVSALLLTGCGGGGDDGGDKKNGDKIEGAGSSKDKDKDEPSPSTSEAGSFKRPKIKLPSDVHLKFDFDRPSDPDEAAASGDAANYVRALRQGITQQTAKTKPLGFYTVPLQSAQEYATAQITGRAKKGMSITGTERYYRNKVLMAENGKFATVTFCSDQKKFFGKDVKSGKDIRGEGGGLNNYLHFSIDMQKAATPKGLWKAHSIEVKERAAQCSS